MTDLNREQPLPRAELRDWQEREVAVSHTLVPYSDQNPIPRASGAIVLLSVALAPLFLASALGGRTPRTSDD